jgi:PAS domain S-box-containing protein
MDVTKPDGTTVSPPSLRVLILEDNPRDAKLTASVLEGGGVRVQFEVTDSPEFFRESLERAEYDVILADFNLRNWTAFDALDILKRSGKDIPLLVVTGSLGDEAAVECIKQGAADFVLKDRPARLPMAIYRALENKKLCEERKRTEEALRASEIQFRRLFEAARDGILILDADTGEIKDVNPFLSDLLDFSRADLLGKKLWEIGPLQDALLSKTSFEDLQSKGYVRYEHLPLESRNGKRIEVEFVSNVYSVNQLKVIQCNIRDITERKRAEEALEKRTRELTYSQEALEQKAQELTRSNIELQQFAYVASHDLQEPLRTMASFAQLLQKRYQGKLDANADDFIHFIVDGATRMQGLIQDLLAYSRVGSRGKDFVPTDCTTVFDRAVANLQTAVTESGAVVTHDPLPTVPCDGAQLIQVFQNLVGNSIKFHDSQVPRVHVAAEQRPSEWVFSVKDNGIGIDPQYAHRIFEVFQRLHNRAEYPGSGIGLAIAKKVVERHGGRIWVESQPHQGASFFFTLPARCDM